MTTLISAARQLRESLHSSTLLSDQVAYVYNPLEYAAEPHETYLSLFGNGRKSFLFLGMNPGPWGMAQTGVPFGEIDHVVSWMGIRGTVTSPLKTHPKKPVDGFECHRSEVSGRRLWGLMKKRYPEAGDFFTEHFVANYCPLLFLDPAGRNLTPDKLPRDHRNRIDDACNEHLAQTVEILKPRVLIGVGSYAEKKLRDLFGGTINTISILHPSPASPKANRGWEEEAVRQLVEAGVWTE